MNNSITKSLKILICLLLTVMLSISGLVSCSPKPKVDDDKPAPPDIELPIDTTYTPESNGDYFYSDRVVSTEIIKRNIPKQVGRLVNYPIPTTPVKSLSAKQIDEVYAENQELMNNSLKDIENNTLKKHIAADGQFYGILPDTADAVSKRILIDTRRAGGRTLGYAPAGEVITITLPDNISSIQAFMGHEEPQFNIPREKYSNNHNRMPILMKAFTLKAGKNYIGTPFGGAVSIFINSPSIPSFTIQVEGVVENPVFNHGITTNEEWKTIREFPGLTTEIYTRYARFIVPSFKVRNENDMETVTDYWYKVGCLSSYATNQENSRSYPVTLNFDNYVAAGGAVNVGGKFTMQPLNAADNTFNSQRLLMNHDWIDMHELNHSFQMSGNVRWGIEESGEVTNNVLSVLSMINYTDIALKRTESPMGFREDTTDPYNSFSNTMKWYNDPQITDYTKYWDEDGHHYNYFIFSDLAHALGVDNVVKLIRSYGDGSCPPLPGYDSNAMNPHYPQTVAINRRDFALRTAKVLGYDMTYFLSVVNKMNLPQSVIDEVKALGKPEFTPVANLYAYGRDDGITKSQTGRPFVIPFNLPYDFDFIGKTLTPLEFTVINAPRCANGTFVKLDNGKYRYTGNGSTENDPFSFKIRLSDQSEVEFFGEIAFRNSNQINVDVWENINITSSGIKGMDEAIAITATRPATKAESYNNGIGIPDNNGNNYHRAQGKFIVPADGTYTFYTKSDDASYFYLSNNSTPDNLRLIAKSLAYSSSYNEQYKSDPINLSKGQILYFKYEVLNINGKGSGRMGYKINSGNIIDIPASAVVGNNVSDEQINQLKSPKKYVLPNQYHSPFIGKTQFAELDKSNFNIVTAPKATSDTSWGKMIDGNTSNYYYSTSKDPDGGRKIIVNLNALSSFNTFAITPHPGNRNGDIKTFALYSSIDGIEFTKVYEGAAASNGKINCIFDKVSAQYFMIDILSTAGSGLAFAEIHFSNSFDSRDGLQGIRNDKFTYSSRPNIDSNGIYESNYLVKLTPDLTATAQFYGNNLAIFALTSKTSGKMEIFIDGNSMGIIDLSSNITQYRQNVYFTNDLDDGLHTIMIKGIQGVANFDFIQVNKLAK